MDFEMFDPQSVVAYGVPLLALVFGLTEFIKSFFSLQGKYVTLLAAGMALLLFIPYQLIGYFPVMEPVLSVIYTSLVFGLSAAGFYKFVDGRAPKNGG